MVRKHRTGPAGLTDGGGTEPAWVMSGALFDGKNEITAYFVRDLHPRSPGKNLELIIEELRARLPDATDANIESMAKAMHARLHADPRFGVMTPRRVEP